MEVTMAQLQDLPIEMILLILDWFCLMVMDEYTDLGSDPWNPCHFEDGPNQSTADDEPPSPAPLRSYVSMLKTCKYFRNVINTRKFEGRKTVPKLLQSLQHRKMKQFVDESSPSKPRLRISLFKKFVGCFWHNPQIIRDGILFGKFFRNLQNHCQWTILPYLHQWVYHHAKPTARSNWQRSHTVDVRIDDSYCVVLTFKTGSLTVRPSSFVFFSVAGVEQYIFPSTVMGGGGAFHEWISQLPSYRDLMLRDHSRISGDIEAEDPDAWWYVFSANTPRETLDDWFLVRWYKENGCRLCKIYRKGYRVSAWNWRPDSPWNPYHWNRDMGEDDALH
jgi:hypothetical protein